MIAAAGVPLAATTAWQGLFDHGGLQAGQTVLIHGGSGGVGGFAVQFAKAKGARVIATASGDGVQTVRDYGADAVVDYKSQKFEDVAHDVDLVFDLIGGETQARSYRGAETWRRVNLHCAEPGQGQGGGKASEGRALHGDAERRPAGRNRRPDRRWQGQGRSGQDLPA